MFGNEIEMKNMVESNHGSKNFQLSADSIGTTMKTQNFLVQKCSLCNEAMELVEGDTIYGDRWYHGNCWNLMKKGECMQ